MRLLRALLASLAVLVVVTPLAGATVLRESCELVMGPAAGNPPPAERRSDLAAAAPRAKPPLAVTFVVELEPAHPRYSSPVFFRDVVLLTRRLLR